MSPMLLVIGSRVEREALGEAPADVLALRRFDELPIGFEDLYSPAIVAIAEPFERDREIRAIRAHRRGGLRPIFVPADAVLSPEIEELVDGSVSSLAVALERAARISPELSALPGSDGPLDADRRLLHFLYARRRRQINPIVDWRRERSYAYPLAEVFADDDVDVDDWLQSLVRREMLAGIEIVSRVRECPDCHSAHLNFIDRCPQCRSLEIEQQAFLHCFGCGKVAPRSQFSNGARLQCPKCRVLLRQVGVDYDRAIDSYLCGSCDVTFSDPEVVAACMSCERDSAPSGLDIRNLRRLELTENGRMAIRVGRLSNVFAALDEFNYTHPDEFYRTLNWFLGLSRRYPVVNFSLVGVRFANVRDLSLRIGPTKTSVFVEHAAERLRSMMRETDVCARPAEDLIWLMLPFTNAEGSRVVQRKIEPLNEQLELNLDRLDVAVATFDGRDVLENEDARMLLSRIAAGIGG